MKYGLAIHTTTGELGFSINNFNGDIRSRKWELGRDLSDYLHEYLLDFIQPQNWSDLGFIGVAKGPGSFTSIRIGVVTAKTLAQQLNIPVYGISSLKSLALSISKKDNLLNPSKHIALEMKASRGQLFVAIYEYSQDKNALIEHLQDTLISPKEWQEILNNWQSDYQLIQSPDNLGYTVENLLELAHLNYQNNVSGNWQDLIPFYGQNPTKK